MLLIDAGRLMAAPLERPHAARRRGRRGGRGRARRRRGRRPLRRRRLRRPGSAAALPPRRAGGDAVVRALFDLEPRPVDADYELAFQTVEGAKRALIVVFCDLLEEAAARPLVDAVPVLARRHVVVVASRPRPRPRRPLATEPATPRDVYGAGGRARRPRRARPRAPTGCERAGASVLEAPAGALPAACVRAYLRAKARARL